jgi:diguanylate cyclase (GGDEF)-like protein
VLSAVSRRVADFRDPDRPGRDDLTGLDVRARLDRELPERLARARSGGHDVALLYCDLDRFKLVNDTLGHGVGDVVLVEAAGRLRDAVRASDLVVRLGGDEFVIVLDGPEAAAAADEVAARLLSSFTAPVDTDDHTLSVGISIGLAVAGPDDDASTLLGRADHALYRAKRRGRGRVARHDHDVELAAAHAATSLELLRDEIRDDHLALDIRPIVDRDLGRVVGHSYRAVWGRTPRTRSAVPAQLPAEVATDGGLAPALFGWTAAATAADRERGRTSMAAVRRFLDLPVEVLVSSPGRALEPILSPGTAPASELVAVIDEAHLGDSDHVRVGLLELARLGVRVCVGSFGSVHGSLVLMERHPFDSVWVDRRSVDGLASCAVRRARLHAVSAMATALGQQVLVDAPTRADDAAALGDIEGLLVVERALELDRIVLPGSGAAPIPSPAPTSP